MADAEDCNEPKVTNPHGLPHRLQLKWAVLSGHVYVCIHGHFYQPPRENPFTGLLDNTLGVAPYANWNERITAETYRPNTAARILDADGLLLKKINNYEWISFNFGATFLCWLEEHDRQTYRAIINADSRSAEHFGGHGSAVAQGYSHTILPLSNTRDRRTQIRWGIADFEHRFGRKPEGFWLPETAADTETLGLLAEEGIVFTILSPYQAAAVREPGQDWMDVAGGRVDSTKSYFVRTGEDRSIAVFFYNGPLSTEIAFNGLLDDGHMLAKRLTHDVGPIGDEPRLSHVATDGESYGHHHRFGEMALAAAIEQIRHNPEAELTNYGQFLELAPPRVEARIVENSSWSCAHGLERWRSDCGCAPQDHPEWSQAWRTPLREALDWLRDRLAEDFVESELFADPWKARDEYVDVVLGAPRYEFITRVAREGFSDDQVPKAAALLEIQHHALLMYASCAWFFDDVGRLESVFALRQAGRAIDLSRRILDRDYEETFLELLDQARSNTGGTARDIYLTHVSPLMGQMPIAGR